MSTNPLHPLSTSIEPPRLFTYPFCYEPHELCRMAAAQVQAYIKLSGVMDGERGGKMFGVLVVRANAGLAFLAAYSGLLAGRNDWDYFVPPIFDAQQPDGHFKQTERAISAINEEVRRLKESDGYRLARQAYVQEQRATGIELSEMKARVAAAKATRRAIRDEAMRQGVAISEDMASRMTRESQFMKAELHRLGLRLKERLALRRREVDRFETRLQELLARRRTMSDELQHWLFSQYAMLNARGERLDLPQIFSRFNGGMPPAGSGDCCAPKLLQYAYEHGLRPLCMAEFWWGESPVGEIRHHLHYYPACRSKCLPILTHMLVGLDVEPNPLARHSDEELDIVYEDDAIAVVGKPAGMLSVPGKDGLPSVESVMRERWHLPSTQPIMPHRLDKDTSGLLVVAHTEAAYAELQRQFAAREVSKRYEALLDGVPRSADGIVSLPLSPDVMDRPRQRVDHEHGKSAITRYHVVRIVDTPGHATFSLVWLYPHTGRTHQLRVHCAHKDGLACPILGDPLYGRGTAASRMWLHAAELSFAHPLTHKLMHFVLPSINATDLPSVKC